jgi:hypothetical protein
MALLAIAAPLHAQEQEPEVREVDEQGPVAEEVVPDDVVPTPPEQAPSDDETEARTVFEAGMHAFDEGHFDRSLDYFRRAYELSARAEILFNIARSYEGLGRRAEAIETYQRYLDSGVGTADTRRFSTEHMALMRTEQTEVSRRRSEEAVDDAVPTVLFTLGGLVTIASSVLIGVAVSENNRIQTAPDGARWRDYSGGLDFLNGLVIITPITLALGIGAIATGIVWIVTGLGARPRSNVSWGPGCVRLSF